MKKIISYSLYGNDPKYSVGMIVNAFLAKEIYDGWVCRVYYDDTAPYSAIEVLKTFDNVELVEMSSDIAVKVNEKMLWRFLPASDDNVDIMISRDADSWLSHRERVCVDAFENSNKTFHIIRDHCYHGMKIMGGMWGCKKGTVENIEKMIKDWKESNQSYDQAFLAKNLYPENLETLMVHHGEQYDFRGRRVYGYQMTDDSHTTRLYEVGIEEGYINDGGVMIPEYDPSLESVAIKDNNGNELTRFSFAYANRLNEFHCAHCGKVHDTFIGGIITNQPPNVIDFLRNYITEKGLSTEGLF